MNKFSQASNEAFCHTLARPPAARRCRLGVSAFSWSPSNSRHPWITVLALIPSVSATARMPPRPNASASLAAHNRRRRSSQNGFNRSYLSRIIFCLPWRGDTAVHPSCRLPILDPPQLGAPFSMVSQLLLPEAFRFVQYFPLCCRLFFQASLDAGEACDPSAGGGACWYVGERRAESARLYYTSRAPERPEAGVEGQMEGCSRRRPLRAAGKCYWLKRRLR
jgi:hypothetical protein